MQSKILHDMSLARFAEAVAHQLANIKGSAAVAEASRLAEQLGSL